MNKQYISLFQQYKTVNPLVTESEFQGYLDKYGDEYLAVVDEEIKKKIPSDQSLSGNQPSTDIIPTVIMEQMNGLPMNQVDSRYEQGVTLPSDTQTQASSESDSTLQQPSMESDLPTGQSTSEENLINAENTSTNPASEDVGNLSIPTTPIINPDVQNLGERIDRNNARLDYIADLYDKNPVVRNGKATFSFDEIDPVEALGGTPQTSRVTEDNLIYISAREGLDSQGNPISTEQEKVLYEDWKAKGYGEVYERDGKPVFATNEKGRKELAPLYQTQTETTVPTIEEPPTPFGSFLDELSLYGAVPTDEERAQMVDTDYREEYLLSTQAAYWAKENGTTFQEEYDRLNADAKYNDTQKIQIASTILNVLNEGIEREGNSADTKEEQDYYNTIRQNPQVLADFGDYLAKNGMDDISFVRGRSFTSQKNRKRLIDEYTNFRLEKEQITMEAAEQSSKASEARLALFERNGDTERYNAEINRINGFKNTYNQAATRAKQIQDNYANVQPIFKKINRQNEELSDFTVRIENNEVGANAVNILGQFPLVVGQKVTSLIGGIGRIANAAIGSENFRDALDIMATEEIKIGNVTAGKIANRVEYFKDANGSEYKEINGTLYSYNNGKIRRLKGNVDKSQLTSQSKDTEYNFTGVVNMTTGLVADALLTRGAMSGLSRGAKFTDYAAKSKRVGEFFGVNSQIAKGMSSLSTVLKNPSAANFAYWNTQFMQDSYIAAKEGGITSETGRYIYAISQSVGLAAISQINPDINILKAMGNSNRSLVNALIRNDIPAAQKAFAAIMDYGKKAGINVAKEVPEELLQQGYQDFSAMLVNQIADKNIKVSEVQDYKELAVGTIGSVALAAAFGGRANVNIGGDNVDVNNMTQPEILTLLARTPNGLEQLKSAKDDVYFESQRTLTDTLIKDVETRKKYLDKIPDIEKYSVAKLSEVVPVMQELERKREQLKNDDGTFAETINNEINSLTSQVNSILSGQPELQNTQETPLQNAETPQPTPQSETVQEQTTVAENEPEQVQTTGTEESSVINEEQQTETTTESNEGTVATEQNIFPDVEDDIEFDENRLNRLVGILNEAAQGNNIGTNGNAESSIDSVQQSEQGGQENPQAVPTTSDGTGSEGDAEVKQYKVDNKPIKEEYKRPNQELNKTEQDWYDRFDKAKAEGNRAEITSLYDKLRVALNGITESEALKNLKEEIEAYGKSVREQEQASVQQTPAFSDNEQTQTLNGNQFERNGKVYTRQDDGSFTTKNKNGVQQKVTNKATVAELNNLATQRREESVTETKENNGYTYKRYADGEQVITSPSGKEIKSHTTRTSRVNGRTNTRKVRNGNFYKERAKIFGEKTDNEIAEENRKRTREALKNFIPTSERDLALLYFANGGKISPASVKKELAGTNARLEERGKKRTITEYKWMWLGDDAKDSFEEVSENITQNEIQEFDQQTLRNELIDVAREYGSRAEVTQEIVDRYNDEVDPYNGFTDEEIAELELAEMSEAKRQFLKSVGDAYGLEDDQLLEYYKEQFKNSLNSLTDEQQDQIYSDSKRTSAQSNNQNQGNEVSNSGEQEVNFQRTDPSAQSLPQPVLEGLIEKLKKPFKKAFKNLNVVYDWKSFAEKARELGVENVDMNVYGYNQISREEVEDAKGRFAAEKLVNEGLSRRDVIIKTGGWFLDTDGKYKKIKFNSVKLKKNIKFDTTNKLGDLIEDGELFKYYPQFKDYTVEFVDMPEQGSFNSRFNIIQINKKNIDDRFRLRNTISHEVQHAIQSVEGFAGGSSSQQFRPIIHRLLNAGDKSSSISRIDAESDRVIERNFGDWRKKYQEGKLSDFQLEQMLYFHTHGEIEARLAESLSNGEISKLEDVFDYFDSTDYFGTVKLMHDTQGEIYGAVLPDGTIYLNPDRFNANTAIHEFTHLWEQIMPNAWKKGVELFKNTQTGKNIFNQLKKEGNYSNLNEEQLWSEALNTHLGNYGGENWQNIRAQSNMDKLRDWFRDFIAKIGEVTGLNSYFGSPLTPETKLDRFTKGVMQDLFNGKALNPESGFEATDVPVVIKQMSDSELETMLTDLGIIQQGKCA